MATLPINQIPLIDTSFENVLFWDPEKPTIFQKAHETYPQKNVLISNIMRPKLMPFVDPNKKKDPLAQKSKNPEEKKLNHWVHNLLTTGADIFNKPLPHIEGQEGVLQNHHFYNLKVVSQINDHETLIANLPVAETANKLFYKTLLVYGGNKETPVSARVLRVFPYLKAYNEVVSKTNDTGLRIIFCGQYEKQIFNKNTQLLRPYLAKTPHQSGAIDTQILQVLNKSKEGYYKPDALLVHSLGALVFEGLKLLNQEERQKEIPAEIIWNRALTSLGEKVLPRINPPNAFERFIGLKMSIMGSITHAFAKAGGWLINPEKALIEATKDINTEVHAFEVDEDIFFGGLARLSSSTVKNLESYAMTYSKEPKYSHHAGADDQLHLADIMSVKGIFQEMKKGETIPKIIIKKWFNA